MSEFHVYDNRLDRKNLEAEIDRLRAELANMKSAVPQLANRAERAEAAIARVRAVPGLNQTTLSVLAKDVLRALDGGTE